MKKILLSVLGLLLLNHEENGEYTIWVIDDHSVQVHEIEGKSEEELSQAFSSSGTVYTIPKYVPNFIVSDFQVGEKVKIYYDGMIKLSAPGQADAYWVEVLD